ncbi:MFS family permease [Methanomicrobium sp. W14]|uniref:MFS transporter n=1 Tax=Methanomicrobium sp. W14 TaxID=2817839 RepID=UPI001AE1B042|nr:MFS transporter [Methanomicrobium sp. W14]MBP2134523.1 MFS family permease [Methanomicrobium sp. W14]
MPDSFFSYSRYISLTTGLGVFSIYFMISAITLANPIIAGNLGLNASDLGLILQAHLLGAVMFLVPAAKLGDIFGHLRIFFTGGMIFAISSLLIAISASGAEIILFRFVQGMGDGMMTASSLVLLTRAYGTDRRGEALGFFLFAGYFGYIIGMTAGSISAETLGWQSVFLIPSFASLAAGILAMRIKNLSTEEIREKNTCFDLKGMILFCPALFLITAAITGIFSSHRIFFIICGVILLVFFVKTEKSAKNPLLMLSLFKNNRLFSLSVCADFLYYSTIGSVSYTFSIFFEKGLNYSAFYAGVLLIPISLMQGILSPATGHLSDKKEPKYLTAAGMSLIVSTLIIYAFIDMKSINPLFITVLLALTGTGYALFSSPNKNAVMSSVKKDYHGEASGIANTFEQIGNITSISIAAGIISIYTGGAEISSGTISEFTGSMQSVFLLMAVLGAANVIVCLKRGNLRKGN